MTIRETIKQKLNKLWQTMENKSGGDLSQELVELSALMGNLSEGIVDLERSYINRQIEIMDEENLSVAKSEVRVRATDEYMEYKKAKELMKALVETVRALKYRLRVLENEEELSRNG